MGGMGFDAEVNLKVNAKKGLLKSTEVAYLYNILLRCFNIPTHRSNLLWMAKFMKWKYSAWLPESVVSTEVG